MTLKIDMSGEAVDRRLRQVEQLRRLCLSLADSSAGREVRREHPENPNVRRLEQALTGGRGQRR